SEPIDPATITSDTVVAGNSNTGLEIVGQRSLDATRTLFRFVATDGLLPTGQAIFVTFTTGIRDDTGTALPNNFTFYRDVGSVPDTNAPVVVTVSPSDGATGIGVNASLRVRFSEPVNPLTVDETTI